LRALHGEESLACASVYHNRGGLLHAQGAFAEAEAPARRPWEISHRTLGESDLRVWLDAIAYAAVLEGLHRYDDCERFYQDALPILLEKLGPEHMEVAALLHNLAALRAARGDYIFIGVL
jgi:Tetratricopeptide repeat